ncbi:MAG: DUF2169 domain-containing protein [Pseudomonadota bacterium]
MELTNLAGGVAAYTLGAEPSGRESVVVVLKRSLEIPAPGGEARFTDETPDLVYADEFTGEPGLSAAIREYDFAAFKPRCDVLVEGPAVAKDGAPTTEMTAGVKIGTVKKSFQVVGPRRWVNGAGGLRPSAPDPFTEASVTYSEAFGGTDVSGGDPKSFIAYRPNPVGRGFAPKTPGKDLDGEPLPLTQEPGRSIRSPGDRLKPMALSPLGRSWPPRIDYAGTYDQAWLDEVFPFLPADFDERYYQAAPADQQTDHLQGGEEAAVLGFSESGLERFILPDLATPIVFYRKKDDPVEALMAADTVVFKPKARRVEIAWRARIALKRDIFELAEAVVGRQSRARLRARELGKTFHAGIAAAIRPTEPA